MYNFGNIEKFVMLIVYICLKYVKMWKFRVIFCDIINY